MANGFTAMPLEAWKNTRDTLQSLTQIIGAVRQADTPRQQHWSHISLRVGAQGLVTPPIPAGDEAFELRVNLTTHRVEVSVSNGGEAALKIPGHSLADLTESLRKSLFNLGIRSQVDWSILDASGSTNYDPDQIDIFWDNLFRIHRVFTTFKGTLRGRTGPVQLWPHHFDLALLWFSGRLIPGTNIEDE